jgi:hypothetical protein
MYGYLYFSVLCLLVWYLLFHMQKARAKRRAAIERMLKASSYSCVCVSFGDKACEAVKRLRDRRFLYRDAPLLPLPGCDVKPCQCRYRHFGDRRHEDRRQAFGTFARADNGQERRYRRTDRRRSYAPRMKIIS